MAATLETELKEKVASRGRRTTRRNSECDGALRALAARSVPW